MTCPNCGTQISSTAAFCPRCGSAIKAEGPMEATMGGTIGGTVGADGGYYAEYGAGYPGGATPGGYPGGYGVSPVGGPHGKPPVKKSGSKTLVYVLIAVIALLMVVTAGLAMGIMLGDGGGDSGPDKDDSYTVVKDDETEQDEDEEPSTEEKENTKPEEPEEAPEEKENTKPKEPKTPKEKVLVSEYTVVYSNGTWTSANNDAYNRGGHLVYINDSTEFNKVCSLAAQYGLNVFWVGAARNYGESWSDVTWGDGSYLWTRWSQGEPSYAHSGDTEQYLMVYKVNGVWGYNDAPNDVSGVYSSSKMGYIIETERYEYR